MPNEKVMNFLENNSYITTKRAEDLGVGRHVLSNMEKRGEIFRVKQGVYSSPKEIPDKFYLIQQGSSKIVFSYTTALYFHGLSDRIPSVIHITVPQGYNTQHLSNHYNNLVVHYVKVDIFTMGLIKVKTPLGNDVLVYDQERCICEMVAKKRSIDPGLFTAAINHYFKSKDKDLRKLIKYSRIFRVERDIRNYTEVL